MMPLRCVTWLAAATTTQAVLAGHVHIMLAYHQGQQGQEQPKLKVVMSVIKDRLVFSLK